MTNHACTYWLLGSILFNESKMQMDELNEKEGRETIPYGTPKCLPLLYALQPYEGKVPLEISDWNVWNCELIPQNDYGLDFGSISKFNHKLVTDLGSNIQVSLSPSLHILKPHLRKTTIALSITSDLFNFVKRIMNTLCICYLVIFLVDIKTKGLGSFFDLVNYFIGRASRREPRFPLKFLLQVI